MGWKKEPNPYSNGTYADEDMQWNLGSLGIIGQEGLFPYASGTFGLAQFAAILLRFPGVMTRVEDCSDIHGIIDIAIVKRKGACGGPYAPTQANILDEILRMNGKEID